jgi:excisionase family DNA binding protein
MKLDQWQLHAAHQLGEAILRFIKTIEEPKQFDACTVPAAMLSEKQPEKARDKSENRLLRVSEVAEMLSLGRTMIYELTYSGRLPSVKIGNARRYKLTEVMKLLDGIE